MNLGAATIIRANSRHLPLADNSVDLVVTSPPYFALRSYQDGGKHYAGQVGDEPTPAEFIDSLLEVTRECVRVLKPSGSLWVNLGDKYGRGSRSTVSLGPNAKTGRGASEQVIPTGYAKSLMGLPWRYALACIDDLGLILRAEVIWSKPNGLPESVTDRVRRSHEQWFHFTLEPRYFSAVDEIREPHIAPGRKAGRNALSGQDGSPTGGYSGHRARMEAGEPAAAANPLGKLPGSVWTIPTEPLKVPAELGIDHFAAFPTEWPRRIINGFSPAGLCDECGEGRRPVTEADRSTVDYGLREKRANERVAAAGVISEGTKKSTLGHQTTRTITSYACACGTDPEWPTHPAVVLDPFGGTGTTAMVAKALGRHGISVDMSSDYCRLAEWRTTDRDQLAKVLGIAKADTVPDPEQMELFA